MPHVDINATLQCNGTTLQGTQIEEMELEGGYCTLSSYFYNADGRRPVGKDRGVYKGVRRKDKQKQEVGKETGEIEREMKRKKSYT